MTPYRLVVIDPPWHRLKKGKTPDGGPSLKVEDFVGDIACIEDEHGRQVLQEHPRGTMVWVWATPAHVPACLELAQHLSLTYVTQRVWVRTENLTERVTRLMGYAHGNKVLTAKETDSLNRAIGRGVVTLQRYGFGHYVRTAHEHALLFRMGRTKSADRTTPSVLLAPHTDSRPMQFYDDCLAIAGEGRAAQIYGTPPPMEFDHYHGEL